MDMTLGKEAHQDLQVYILTQSPCLFGPKDPKQLTNRSSLTSLGPGRMTFASTLRSLKFGDGFNQNLLKLQLPSSLESLSLGDAWLFKAACWISGDASGCGAGRVGWRELGTSECPNSLRRAFYMDYIGMQTCRFR